MIFIDLYHLFIVHHSFAFTSESFLMIQKVLLSWYHSNFSLYFLIFFLLTLFILFQCWMVRTPYSLARGASLTLSPELFNKLVHRFFSTLSTLYNKLVHRFSLPSSQWLISFSLARFSDALSCPLSYFLVIKVIYYFSGFFLFSTLELSVLYIWNFWRYLSWYQLVYKHILRLLSFLDFIHWKLI